MVLSASPWQLLPPFSRSLLSAAPAFENFKLTSSCTASASLVCSPASWTTAVILLSLTAVLAACTSASSCLALESTSDAWPSASLTSVNVWSPRLRTSSAVPTSAAVLVVVSSWMTWAFWAVWEQAQNEDYDVLNLSIHFLLHKITLQIISMLNITLGQTQHFSLQDSHERRHGGLFIVRGVYAMPHSPTIDNPQCYAPEGSGVIITRGSTCTPPP